MTPTTLPPTLRDYLIGDLGPARRHLYRLQNGELAPSPAVLGEIQDSIARCIDRMMTIEALSQPVTRP